MKKLVISSLHILTSCTQDKTATIQKFRRKKEGQSECAENDGRFTVRAGRAQKSALKSQLHEDRRIKGREGGEKEIQQKKTAKKKEKEKR